MRERFWLAMLDVAYFISRRYEPGWMRRLQLWLIRKCSDAVDWEGLERRSGVTVMFGGKSKGEDL